MTEKETEGLTLLQHYVSNDEGRAILTKFGESIQVAHRFERQHWMPTVREGWGMVNLRIGKTYAITLRRDEVEILLMPRLLNDSERHALDDHEMGFRSNRLPGARRYRFDLAQAGARWESVKHAHHAVLENKELRQRTRTRNPEAIALIDFLNRELDVALPYPERELSAPLPSAFGAKSSRMELLDAFAASEPGRAILRATARSIETANEAGRGHWGTTVEKDGAYVALNIGNACAIRLHADKVRILLFPDRLDTATRDALEENASHSWDRPAIPGSRNFELDWLSAAQMWGALEGAHHAVLTADPHRRTTFYKSHSNVVIDFLNRTLDLELPYPDYGIVSNDGSDREKPGFRKVLRSLEKSKLHFPTEAVANYLLALQTKRFAILTGISGTGKTRIAMAVARSFPATIRDRRAAGLDGSSAPDDAVAMTAQPYHFKDRQIVLPAAFVAEVDPLLTPGAGTNSGTVAVCFPEGLATLGFYRDPTPGKNQTELRFARAHDFRDWYRKNLKPGDQFYISFLEADQPEEHRIEFRLAKTEVAERELDNHVVVPVRPDWVDNRGLLGYFNPITGTYSTTSFLSRLLEAREEEARATKERRAPHPFFIVLDEMNLARVEHYFSDFLSALESDEPIPLHDDERIADGAAESGIPVPRQLRVPKNVFFTGTVNVDETTYMFSPKVLDRAFTIEFDRVDLHGFATGIHAEEEAGLSLDGGDGGLGLTPYRRPERDDFRKFSKLEGGRFHRKLLELHAVLEAEHRHFGYRVANEIARFVNLAHEQSTDPKAAEHAFDLALLQKVLPKFHGTQQELEPILRRLASALGATLPDASEDVPAGTSAAGPEPSSEGRALRFPRTGTKIQRMLKRLEQRGFTSFIE